MYQNLNIEMIKSNGYEAEEYNHNQYNINLKSPEIDKNIQLIKSK